MSKTTIPTGGITDGTLTSAKLDQDGAFVFNEDSADVDFRVEGNGNSSLFVVDAGNDRIGIGTATPSALVDASVSAGSDAEIRASAGTVYTKLIANDSNGHSEINFSHDIRVKDGGDSNDERFRVNGDGTIDINNGGGTNNTSVWTMKVRQTGNASATHYMMAFAKQNDSTVGSIQTDGSNTSYNTSSDYRLKENIVDLTGAIDRVKTLKPKRFNFKDNPSKTQDGFLAHEIITVPEAVNGTKDATETYTDDDGNEQTRILPQQLDQSKLVPLLTKALQEAITEIESLKARVTTLEG